jgi:HlyD family secretion protein
MDTMTLAPPAAHDEAARRDGTGHSDTAPDAPEQGRAPPRRGRVRWLTRRRALWSAVAAGAVLLLALALRPTPLEVQTAVVARGPLETVVEADGKTRVADRYAIAAPVSGRLERISLREGDAVAAGDIIARLQPLPLDPQADAQARARVASAAAAVREAGVRVDQAREARTQAERTAARVLAIGEAGAMSVDAVERAQLESVLAVRDHDAAVARATAVSAELTAARAALFGTAGGGGTGAVVRSPAAGRVLLVPEPSERVVMAGTPLLVVGDADALEIVVDVLSTDAVRIEPGSIMRIVEWGGDDVLEARVRRVEPAGFTKISALGVEEQRVNVIGDLPTRPAALGDGYQVQVRIVTWATADVLKVPNSALFRTGDGWSAFVVENGRAERRNVIAGRRGLLETEIQEGLGADDRVILFPSDRVKAGTRVRNAAQ